LVRRSSAAKHKKYRYRPCWLKRKLFFFKENNVYGKKPPVSLQRSPAHNFSTSPRRTVGCPPGRNQHPTGGHSAGQYHLGAADEVALPPGGQVCRRPLQARRHGGRTQQGRFELRRRAPQHRRCQLLPLDGTAYPAGRGRGRREVFHMACRLQAVF
jgi:hypothetical protein